IQDWEDSVPRIFKKTMGYDLDWTMNEAPVFGPENRRTLDLICRKAGVPPEMVAKLLDIERDLNAMIRRSSIHQKIAATLEKDWRTKKELISLKTGDPDDVD